MRDVAKALKEFVGGFSIPAYAADSVPKDVKLPYLTYPIVEPEWNQQASFYIQGWYKTTKYDDLLAKADQVVKEIGSGIILGMQSGYLVIYPETPLIQTSTDQANETKSFYINLAINAYHTPGE